MPEAKAPKPPAGTATSGRALWRSVLDEYVLEEHELALLREMVRTVDMLDVLQARVAAEGELITNPSGVLKAHPALVEARQLRIAFARLSAALRLPAGEEGDGQAGARRPQRRVGVRRPYGLRSVS